MASYMRHGWIWWRILDTGFSICRGSSDSVSSRADNCSMFTVRTTLQMLWCGGWYGSPNESWRCQGTPSDGTQSSSSRGATLGYHYGDLEERRGEDDTAAMLHLSSVAQSVAQLHTSHHTSNTIISIPGPGPGWPLPPCNCVTKCQPGEKWICIKLCLSSEAVSTKWSLPSIHFWLAGAQCLFRHHIEMENRRIGDACYLLSRKPPHVTHDSRVTRQASQFPCSGSGQPWPVPTCGLQRNRLLHSTVLYCTVLYCTVLW